MSTFCTWQSALVYLFLNVSLFVSNFLFFRQIMDFVLFFLLNSRYIFKYFIVLNFYCWNANDVFFSALGILNNLIAGRWRIKQCAWYNSVVLLFSQQTHYKYAISDVTRVLAHSRCTQSYLCDSCIHVSYKSFDNAFTVNTLTSIVINTNDGAMSSHTSSLYNLENSWGDTTSFVLCVFCIFFFFLLFQVQWVQHTRHTRYFYTTRRYATFDICIILFHTFFVCLCWKTTR